jgi:hypothetical protein
VDSPERVTDTVERLLGRPARTFRSWVEEHADDFRQGSWGWVTESVELADWMRGSVFPEAGRDMRTATRGLY